MMFIGSSGAGVKQTTNIRSANTASHDRPRSIGSCSSRVRGCRGPKITSIAVVTTVQTTHDQETNTVSATRQPTVLIVMAVLMRPPSTA